MISAVDLSVGYPGLPLIEGLNLDVPAGAVLALIGASGSGKTTLLRTIAGLHRPQKGQVGILGEPPAKLFGTGRVQYLHQSPALWKHLTVQEHVKLGLELVHEPVRQNRVSGILEQVGLGGSENKLPHELSRGMQARLALARAFAAPPEILLMDEPFASLDPLRREQLNHFVQSLREDSKCTIVMVTHDIVEAVRFATLFTVLAAGTIHPVTLKNGSRNPQADPNRLGDAEIALRDRITALVRPRSSEIAA